MRASRLAPWLSLLGAAVHAQVAPVDPDWREAEAPPPPAVRTEGLIPLEMPRSNLRFGVDPASVSLGKDGIVRYVVVATGEGGALNALYEALRCDTGQFKVYARYNAGSGWTIVKDSQWRELRDAPGSSHGMAIARSGACVGRAPNGSASQIVRDLSAPVNRRFGQPQ